MFLDLTKNNYKEELRFCSFISTFKKFYHTMTTSQAAIYTLNQTLAMILAIFFAAFVGSLYIWGLLGYNVTNRNSKVVIKQRITSAIIVCIVAPIILSYFVLFICLSVQFCSFFFSKQCNTVLALIFIFLLCRFRSFNISV